MLNPKIEQIETAEQAIETFTTELEELRARALDDGIIDADEQADLDRVEGRIGELRTLVGSLRATLEENRRIWDAQQPARDEWADQLRRLQEAEKPDLAGFESAATDMEDAVEDQRWADATTTLNQTREAMQPVYQAFMEEAAELAGAGGGGGGPADAPPAPSADPAQDEWQSVHSAYTAAMAALQRHAQAGNAALAGDITTVTNAATSAEAKANSGDFAAAVADLRPMIARCAEIEDKAHAVANYEEVLARRTAQVNDPSSAPVGDNIIDDLQTEMATLLADAQTDAAAGRYAEAVQKLDRIPAIFDRKRGLAAMRSDYLTRHGTITTSINNIDGFTPAERAPFQAQVDRLKTEFAAAEIGQTNDYSVSSARLRALEDEFSGIDDAIWNSTGYQLDLQSFDNQLAVLEPHAGRVAIEEFYQARLLDRDRAVSDAANARFTTASAQLNATSGADWTAQKAIADAYVTYQANRQTTAATIAEVAAMPGAADLIGQADALMQTAADQALAGDIAGAEQSLTEAATRAEDARAAAESQAALDAMHDEDALDNVEADYAAALAVFSNMRAHVAGEDTSGTFTARIAEADAPVTEAQAQVDGGSPDMTIVRAKLDEGIAILQDVLPQIIAYGLFKTHEAQAITLVGTLGPLNTANGNCIQGAIDACTPLLAEAQNLAQPPAYDFVAAEDKLSELMEHARAAQANVTLYSTNILPNKNAMDGAVTQISGAGGNVPTIMAFTLTRLNDLLSDITQALRDEDFALADAKGREGAGVVTAVTQDIGIAQWIDARYAPWVTNQMATIQGGQPEVAIYLQQVNDKIAQYNAALAAGGYRNAEQLLKEISWAMQDGQAAIAQAGPYNIAKTAARTTLDNLVANRNAGIEDRLTALEERYTAAEALAAVTADNAPQFVTATGRMSEISQEATALMPEAVAYGAYETARASAEPQLVAAETHDQRAAIDTTVIMLRTKFSNAEELAAGGDAARAQTLMAEVENGATDAIENADNVAIFAGISEAIGDSSSDTFGPTMVHIAAARQAHDWQASKPNASVAAAELTEASTKIDRAEDDSVPANDQTTALESAMDLITQAGQIISQHELLTQAVTDARNQLAMLRGHAQSAYLATQLDEMEAGIDNAESGATDIASLPACTTELENVMLNVEEYRTKLDAQQEYVDLRPTPEVEPRLAELEAHDHAYAVQTSIDAMRSKLADAARLSAEFDPVAAVALLNEVKTIGLSALVLADMRNNDVPTTAQLEEILARPDGQAELDAMIDQLEPDAQRDVLAAAFEARFGCTLQDLTGGAATDSGADIRRFYEVMSDLPSTDTLDNDSLRTFTIAPPTSASSFTGGTVKEIEMREGDAVLSGSYTFGSEFQVGEVEPGCEPANEEPVNFFSWNTLHEVGHAVDDQHRFMASREEQAAFGGWKEYGGNTAPIADVVAAHFDFDRDYVQQSLGQRLAVGVPGTPGSNPADALPEPPTSAGCSAEEWESRRVAFTAWLARVREPREPWASQSTAQQIAINGKVYHECYTGQWVSYDLAARSRGVTAYQFRSPAEWFSELYAAYHSGKIQDSHPAASWLAELATPDQA